LVCQVDLLASLATLTNQRLQSDEAPDSFDVWAALSGKSATGRTVLVQQGGALSIVKDNWKYIEPHKGPKVYALVDIESGNDEGPQLYNLGNDIAEQHNLADKDPDRVKELDALLQKIKASAKSR